MSTRCIRVAAVDDHPIMLQGLQQAMLEVSDRFGFVAAFDSVPHFVESRSVVDVVLLDLSLGDGSRPADNVRAIRETGAHTLVFTEGSRRPWMTDALSAGALGVVLKSSPLPDLLDAIESVSRGELSLSAEVAQVLRHDEELRPHLTTREVDALKGVARGLADKQIATVMQVTQETVKEHLKRIRTKYADLGRSANSRVDLLKRALEDGIVDVNEPA